MRSKAARLPLVLLFRPETCQATTTQVSKASSRSTRCAVRQGTAHHNTARHRTAQHRHSMAQHSTARHAAQCSTAQCSTAKQRRARQCSQVRRRRGTIHSICSTALQAITNGKVQCMLPDHTQPNTNVITGSKPVINRLNRLQQAAPSCSGYIRPCHIMRASSR